MAASGQSRIERAMRSFSKFLSRRRSILHAGPQQGYNSPAFSNSATTPRTRRWIADLQGLATFTRLLWHVIRPVIKRGLRNSAQGGSQSQQGNAASDFKARMQGTILFGAAAFAWDRDRIKDEEIESCLNTPEVKQARPKTPTPSTIQSTADEPPYPDSVAAAGLLPIEPHLFPQQSFIKPSAVAKQACDEWELVVKKDNFRLWRKLHNANGVYCYKMMGSYRDVSARAFYKTQMDLEYRKKWDTNALELKVIEQDPATGSEVIYWSHKYPFPMKSREYVYIRRAEVCESNALVIVSRAVEHPECPESSNYVRVKEYVSQMVIIPHTDIDKDGLDYVCTYFDDPNTYIPSACLRLAYRGVPDFMEKLHTATLERGHVRKENQELPQQRKTFPWHRQRHKHL